MKNIAVILLALLALSACRTPYDITLTNGMKITGVSKPKYDQVSGSYIFKDASGRTNFIPRMRVSVIEPHERSTEEGRFKPKEQRKKK